MLLVIGWELSLIICPKSLLASICSYKKFQCENIFLWIWALVDRLLFSRKKVGTFGNRDWVKSGLLFKSREYPTKFGTVSNATVKGISELRVGDVINWRYNLVGQCELKEVPPYHMMDANPSGLNWCQPKQSIPQASMLLLKAHSRVASNFFTPENINKFLAFVSRGVKQTGLWTSWAPRKTPNNLASFPARNSAQRHYVMHQLAQQSRFLFHFLNVPKQCKRRKYAHVLPRGKSVRNMSRHAFNKL